MHFELQAFAGACRTLLDEFVYAVARRHGATPAHARKKPWETSDLVQRPLPLECDVDEIRWIRSESSWFDTLNAYRNSFFHHGWRHGSGHFADDDVRRASASAASNGLLVPDRASLIGRKKPFEWTWEQRLTVDDIAQEIRRGTDLLVEELGRAWSVPQPGPGNAPLDDRPNMLIAIARPGVIYSDRLTIVPVFSTRELGEAFKGLRDQPDLELIDVPVSTALYGQEAVAISMRGLRDTHFGRDATHLDVFLDPDPNNDWTHVKVTAHTRVPLPDAATLDMHPIGLPLSGCERVWMWRRKEPRSW